MITAETLGSSRSKEPPIAPSPYHAQVAIREDPDRESAGSKRDAELRIEIRRAWQESFRVYCARKV